MWIPLQEWMGKRGTENGIVIKDEEYEHACRITLEKCKQYYAVTCGVYGSMVHTAFFDKADYETKYEEMKCELQDFVDRLLIDALTEDDRSDFYAQFCDKY